jgi:RNA polymerase sigma-70 factor (ECF subfamily)
MRAASPAPDERTALFERHRRELEALAYRMLGTLADAHDAVQEAWLRWRTIEVAAVRDARAWLLTCVARIALDVLKSASRRRESYPGVWLPEPWLDGPGADPAEQAELDDSLSAALLVALERLTPAERAAYVLHEVFARPFEEIAQLLARTPEATRKLASRARTRVLAERPRFPTSERQHRELLEAFVAAARSGDLARLEALFVAHVELHADGGGLVPTAPEVLRGSSAVTAFLARVWGTPSAGAQTVEFPRFNGQPGLLLRENGRSVVALSLELENGRIRRLFALRNPDKLAPFG